MFGSNTIGLSKNYLDLKQSFMFHVNFAKKNLLPFESQDVEFL